MPWKLRKAPKRDLYWVVDDKGHKYSKNPMPKEAARRQQKALYAAESRGEMEGHGVATESPPPPPPPNQYEKFKKTSGHYDPHVPIEEKGFTASLRRRGLHRLIPPPIIIPPPQPMEDWDTGTPDWVNPNAPPMDAFAYFGE